MLTLFVPVGGDCILTTALVPKQYDADCELFVKILFGQMCEQTYHEQMGLVDRFLSICTTTDRENSGGRQIGLIARTEFMTLLAAEFSLKTATEMKNLKRALSTDQPLPSIDYKKLFESDRCSSATLIHILQPSDGCPVCGPVMQGGEPRQVRRAAPGPVPVGVAGDVHLDRGGDQGRRHVFGRQAGTAPMQQPVHTRCANIAHWGAHPCIP